MIFPHSETLCGLTVSYNIWDHPILRSDWQRISNNLTLEAGSLTFQVWNLAHPSCQPRVEMALVLSSDSISNPLSFKEGNLSWCKDFFFSPSCRRRLRGQQNTATQYWTCWSLIDVALPPVWNLNAAATDLQREAANPIGPTQSVWWNARPITFQILSFPLIFKLLKLMHWQTTSYGARAACSAC